MAQVRREALEKSRLKDKKRRADLKAMKPGDYFEFIPMSYPKRYRHCFGRVLKIMRSGNAKPRNEYHKYQVWLEYRWIGNPTYSRCHMPAIEAVNCYYFRRLDLSKERDRAKIAAELLITDPRLI